MRKAGRLVPGNPGHPKDLSRFFVLFVDLTLQWSETQRRYCYAIDRISHKRYIVDAIKITRPYACTNHDSSLPIGLTYMHHRNGSSSVTPFNLFSRKMKALDNSSHSKGTVLREHHTGNNKWDAGFGVASMSTLFGTKQPDGKHHRE
jgi:hypothetical protein